MSIITSRPGIASRSIKSPKIKKQKIAKAGIAAGIGRKEISIKSVGRQISSIKGKTSKQKRISSIQIGAINEIKEGIRA